MPEELLAPIGRNCQTPLKTAQNDDCGSTDARITEGKINKNVGKSRLPGQLFQIRYRWTVQAEGTVDAPF
jgi:hypothetical protein